MIARSLDLLEEALSTTFSVTRVIGLIPTPIQARQASVFPANAKPPAPGWPERRQRE